MKRVLWVIAGAVTGYAVGVGVVAAAMLWGHLVHFGGFGLLRGALLSLSLAAVGALLGFVAVYRPAAL